jgi:hypothetical protein
MLTQLESPTPKSITLTINYATQIHGPQKHSHDSASSVVDAYNSQALLAIGSNNICGEVVPIGTET